MKKRVALFLAALVVLAVAPGFAQKKIELKLAHLNAQKPYEIPSAAIAAVFKASVEANSNGEIEVKIFDSGVLGKERETMIQVQNNIVQSYIASTGGMSTFYPLIDVTNIPFAFSSYSVGYKVYDGEFGKAMGEDIRKKTKLKVLGFGESGGFFAFTNSKRPIKGPDDLKGLKIRTMTVPLHQDIVKSLGGSPTAIAWAEVYTSLQTGVVDGQMNPISIINMAKFYEVQKYITLTNHLYAPYVWVMSDAFYTKLSADHRRIVEDAAKEAVLAGRGLSRLIDSTEKGLPVLQEKMQVYTPTSAELRAFREKTFPAAKAFLEKQYGKEGAQWTDRFLKAIVAAEKD